MGTFAPSIGKGCWLTCYRYFYDITQISKQEGLVKGQRIVGLRSPLLELHEGTKPGIFTKHNRTQIHYFPLLLQYFFNWYMPRSSLAVIHASNCYFLLG